MQISTDSMHSAIRASHVPPGIIVRLLAEQGREDCCDLSSVYSFLNSDQCSLVTVNLSDLTIDHEVQRSTPSSHDLALIRESMQKRGIIKYLLLGMIGWWPYKACTPDMIPRGFTVNTIALIAGQGRFLVMKELQAHGDPKFITRFDMTMILTQPGLDLRNAICLNDNITSKVHRDVDFLDLVKSFIPVPPQVWTLPPCELRPVLERHGVFEVLKSTNDDEVKKLKRGIPFFLELFFIPSSTSVETICPSDLVECEQRRLWYYVQKEPIKFLALFSHG